MSENDNATAVGKLVRALLQGFTTHHADLKIRSKQLGSIVSVEISGNADDQPKMVGSKGGHISALTRIMRSVGAKRGLRVVLSLNEPTVGVKQPPKPFIPNPRWKPDATRKLLKQTLEAILTQPPRIEEHHDENNSIFAITPAPADDGLIDKDLEAALNAIFDAVGKANGRTVHIAGPASK